MTEHVITVDDTGEVKVIQIDRGSLNTPAGPNVIHHGTPIDNMDEFIQERYWDFDELEFMPRVRRPNLYATWDGGGWDWDSADVLNDIRLERQRLLFMSDWTQVTDAPLSAAQVTQWRTYRQALRDLPGNLGTIPDNVNQVVWPTPPTT